VSGAAAAVVSEISAHGGALRFDRFMQTVLYGEHGFYTRSRPSGAGERTGRTDTGERTGRADTGGRSGRAGRRGDFLTSPEVGPLFGAVIARALDTWWHEMSEPDPFVVVDAGAGPGTLARSVLAARPECGGALRYVAVELSADQRAAHPAGVESRAELPTTPFVGVILANELLDNLPFRLFVFDDGWKEAFVASDGSRFVEVLRQCTPLPSVLPECAAHGARAAVCDAAAEWVGTALSRLTSGRLVVIDYATTTQSMTERAWREWLRTYAAHQRGGHYLSSVGEQDLTVEVPLDQLPVATTVSTQSQFLRRYGIDALVAEGKAAWQRQTSAPDLAAMMMRSRVSEAEALLDPSGLGAFSVVEWRR
jgi:SAM-dependent MidA family methyltransferase